MSYSRWSGADWYIYWDCSSGDTRDTQLLAIWHVSDAKHPLYSYKELKNDREKVWKDIASRTIPTERGVFDSCIDYFIKDVENDNEIIEAQS